MQIRLYIHKQKHVFMHYYDPVIDYSTPNMIWQNKVNIANPRVILFEISLFA